MSVPLDQITQRKIVLAKQIHNQATTQSASQLPISRILGVIGLDLANETLLRTIVGTLDPTKTPSESFPSVLQQVDDLISKASLGVTPDRANLMHVHSIRNDCQHKAKYPSDTETIECRIYCRDFLQKTVALIWGLDFSLIRLADLVLEPKARQLLIEAEETNAKSEYFDAIGKASAALEWVLKQTRHNLVGQLSVFAKGIVLVDAFGELQSQREDEQAGDAFRKMQDAVFYLAVGFDFNGYKQLSEIAGATRWTLNGKYVRSNPKPSPTASESEFVLSYCTNAITLIENRIGAVDAPWAIQK
jgi:hypothetical protein